MKIEQHEGEECEVDIKNTMQGLFGSFLWSNRRRIMNTFIRGIIGFKTMNVFFTDTESLYIEKKHWDVLDKIKLVGKRLRQSEKGFKSGGIFSHLFLAPKIKCCLTIKEFGILEEQKTFKGFSDSERLLDRQE